MNLSQQNHSISLTEAIRLTTLYRQNKEKILDPGYQGANILALSETFDRSAIDKLLMQTDCAALRIYFGMDDQLKVHAVLVGVNSNNEDILPEDPNVSSDQIAEHGLRCPTECPEPSPLNS